MDLRVNYKHSSKINKDNLQNFSYTKMKQISTDRIIGSKLDSEIEKKGDFSSINTYYNRIQQF